MWLVTPQNWDIDIKDFIATFQNIALSVSVLILNWHETQRGNYTKFQNGFEGL